MANAASEVQHKSNGVLVFLAAAIPHNVGITMGQRSYYLKPFEAQVVQECLQPDATIPGVAINHGINATLFENGCRFTEISRQRRTVLFPLKPTAKKAG